MAWAACGSPKPESLYRTLKKYLIANSCHIAVNSLSSCCDSNILTGKYETAHVHLFFILKTNWEREQTTAKSHWPLFINAIKGRFKWSEKVKTVWKIIYRDRAAHPPKISDLIYKLICKKKNCKKIYTILGANKIKIDWSDIHVIFNYKSSRSLPAWNIHELSGTC